MAYAIINISGLQMLIEPNRWYDIDFLKNTHLGDSILLSKVLLLKRNNKVQLGYPFLENSHLLGKIIQQIKGRKITVLKTKPKKNYTRVQGHRQKFTRVLIENI